MKLSNQTKISIFSAICLLGLVVVLKNVLRVPAEILLRDIIIYIPFYSVISIIYPSVDENKKYNKPTYWYLTILIVTLAILAVYIL